MSFDWKKKLGIVSSILGTAFVSTSIIAWKKKNSSVYGNKQNPMEGKKVVFIKNDEEPENADGVRGHLEAVGENEYTPGFYEKNIKRGIDIVLSFGAIVLLSPLFIGISIAIFIDDPGPILFTQKRIGQNKKYFKLHKFRSMKMSTPHNTPTHMLENPEQYITKVGKFLRAHSLDELPQIWDIFIGNMSVIGPRPGLWNQDVLTAERDKYGANDVKPGLTGWAQINGRDELEIPEKARLDGEYVRKLSFLMDVKCFLGSIGVFIHDKTMIEGGIGKMKKKSIVVLSSHTPSLFWFRMDMMKEFIVRGYDVYALGNESEGEWKNKFLENGIYYRNINVERNGTNPLKDVRTFFSIRKELKKIRPEKIFTFQAKTVIYGGIAAKTLGIKEIYPMIAGIGSIFLKNDLKTKIIRIVMALEYKIAISEVPAIFFQNCDDVQIFRDSRILNKEKVVLLPGSGVNIEHFTVASFPETTAFLCVSRLIRDKGVYEYLEAAKRIKNRYPEVRCMLVGPYDSNPSAITEDELKPFLNVGIEYFGEQRDVRPYLKQATVFVLPSYREGTPKTVLEAMATGRAIITTNAPGCKETVIDGENGVLIPTKDIEGLYNSMEKFVQKIYDIKEMGMKGRKMAETIFDVKLVNQKICETMKL